MKIFKEEEILDPEFRQTVIKEIEAPENVQRKRNSLKRWEIYRDFVKKYVLDKLTRELDPETVIEMEPRTSAINITKKIVNKKARIYKNAPLREAIEPVEQEGLDELLEYFNLNSIMKKVNRYVELFKNCMVYIQPIVEPETDDWYIKLSILPPHLYDVIEDVQCREKERVVILSEFTSKHIRVSQSPHERDIVYHNVSFRDGNNKDEIIADSPGDMNEKHKRYVWWSKNYHFTVDKKGKYDFEKSPEDLMNPINELPFVSFNKDQDGSYWALGGEDLIDGTVLINVILSDLYFAQKLHGSGIFYYFGKDAPKSVRLGPNHAITGELEENDPTPQIGFASNNVLINEILATVEQYIAMLLSTNDLGTGAISGKLDGSTATSGVHELIQNAEPLNAIEDEQEMYLDQEPLILQKALKWFRYYSDSNRLYEEVQFENVDFNRDYRYSIKFGSAHQTLSEKEKLEILKTRKELGLNTMLDLVMIDNPDMTRAEAEEKLMKIMQEKLEKQARMFGNADNQDQNQLPSGPEQGNGGDKQEAEGED